MVALNIKRAIERRVAGKERGKSWPSSLYETQQYNTASSRRYSLHWRTEEGAEGLAPVIWSSKSREVRLIISYTRPYYIFIQKSQIDDC